MIVRGIPRESRSVPDSQNGKGPPTGGPFFGAFSKTLRAASNRKKAAARTVDIKHAIDLLQQRGERGYEDRPDDLALRGDKAVEKAHAVAAYQLAEFLVVVLVPLLQVAHFPLEVLGPARGDRLVEHFDRVGVGRQGIVIVALEEQIECRLDIHGAVAQIERDVQRIIVHGLDLVRGAAAQEQHVAGPHHDLGLERSHARFRQIGQVDPSGRLAPVYSPLLGSGKMDREDVVGIKVASVRLVASLRKEHDRVAESTRMRPVQGGRQEVDLGLEDVYSLEHARGAVFQVLLQHAAIDEFDLPALHDFETARPAQLYELSAIDDLQEVQIEERVVEVLAEILKPEDRLVGDEPRFVKVALLERERQGLLKDKIPDKSQLRGEVRLCRVNRHEVERFQAPIGVGVRIVRHPFGAWVALRVAEQRHLNRRRIKTLVDIAPFSVVPPRHFLQQATSRNLRYFLEVTRHAQTRRQWHASCLLKR